MATPLTHMIQQGLTAARDAGTLTFEQMPDIVLEAPRQAAHGDVACPVALGLAKQAKKNPRQIAEILVEAMELPETLIAKVEIAGPGFINFHLQPAYWTATLPQLLAAGDTYGVGDSMTGQKVLVEFVSANPTGPLHVGHGRGAVVGDALASLLTAAGAQVDREYYVNDVGNQMNILGRSTYVRYCQLQGRDMELPDNHYQGDYIHGIAQTVVDKDGDRYLDLPEDDWLPYFRDIAQGHILATIRAELDRFGIHFEQWFSERRLYEGTPNRVQTVMDELTTAGAAYEQDGARWLATTRHGDDKDRVMVRSNGETTYFASDVAYHQEKFGRGYDRLIDVWGADHHGYIGRMKAAATLLGRSPDDLTVVLVQLVSLLRDGQPVAMSTRSGQFVTLAEVSDEIGSDACRFYFLTRKSDAQLEFDLAVAKAKTADNPVYYVQYAHARVCQLFGKAKAANIGLMASASALGDITNVDLSPLQDAETVALIKLLNDYPKVVAAAADELAVHKVPYYLQELASRFHAYYYKHRFVGEEIAVSEARLVLAGAVRQVLKNGLTLIGVSAPDRM